MAYQGFIIKHWTLGLYDMPSLNNCSTEALEIWFIYFISTFLLLSLGQYLCWWTIIIRPLVSASALTWFTRTIFRRNLQLLNHGL
jgi:hypothetical protein